MKEDPGPKDLAPDPWRAGSLQRFRSNCLARGVEGTNTGWQDVLIPLGFAIAANCFDDKDMADWSQRWAAYHLSVPVRAVRPGSAKSLLLDQRHKGIVLSTYCGQWGALSVLSVLERTARRRNEARRGVIRQMADYICDKSIRIGSGLIAHGFWALEPWVDTLYYLSTPLALAFDVTKEERYATEAIQQCLLHARYLRDDVSGCFFHHANLDRGTRSNWLWSRGNGWAVMALADVLRSCPREMPGWLEVRDIYTKMSSSLLRMQHSTGLWRIMPENPESHLETSGSAMIATGLAIGLAEGWLEREVGPYLQRTWHETATWVNDDGRLMGCQTPAGTGGWERHKLAPLGETAYGTGSLLRLSAELRLAGLI